MIRVTFFIFYLMMMQELRTASPDPEYLQKGRGNRRNRRVSFRGEFLMPKSIKDFYVSLIKRDFEIRLCSSIFYAIKLILYRI